MNYYRYLSVFGIIILASMIFAIEQSRETSFDDWGMNAVAVREAFGHLREAKISGQDLQAFATLVTHQFLHGGVDHIVFNMLFLWIFGYLNCEVVGQWRTLAAFLVCGAGGGILQAILVPEAIPAVGASGSICGLEGLYVGIALKWDLPYANVWPLAYPVPSTQFIALAAIGFVGDLLLMTRHDHNIAFGGHLGGLLTGVLIAAVLTTIYPTRDAYIRAGRRRSR
jgi:membrane associated rhomboid family serine protease